MNPRVLIIIGFLAAVGGVFYLSQRGNGSGDTGSGGSSAPSKPSVPTDVTEITFLYSTEKQDWVESAREELQQEHPTSGDLVGQGSLDAAQAILDGREKPTVWSPADSAVLRMLAADWATEPHTGRCSRRRG